MMNLIKVTLFFFCASSEAKDLNVVFKNNMALKKIERERVVDAYEEFVGLLARSPFDPTLQFNVGSSLILLGEKEKAPILYKQLLTQVDELLKKENIDPDLKQELYLVKFAIHYNLGVLHQAEQQIEPALEHYQAALELKPDSKEIKTNIEMMFGSGGGKGDKNKKEQDKEGEGDNKDSQGQDGKDPKDKKEDKKDSESPQEKQEREKLEKEKQKQREFDQKQMSMEDLKRIMEELKDQEQGIRAKFQGKGGKNGRKEKEW